MTAWGWTSARRLPPRDRGGPGRAQRWSGLRRALFFCLRWESGCSCGLARVCRARRMGLAAWFSFWSVFLVPKTGKTCCQIFFHSKFPPGGHAKRTDTPGTAAGPNGPFARTRSGDAGALRPHAANGATGGRSFQNLTHAAFTPAPQPALHGSVERDAHVGSATNRGARRAWSATNS